MIQIECPECGSSDIILRTNMEVDFVLDNKRQNIELLTDVYDELYYKIAHTYNIHDIFCVCQKCDEQFVYSKTSN